jgi:hypothetical protein
MKNDLQAEGVRPTLSLLFKDGVQKRDPSLKDTDKSALYATVQAAVNVELFTIPLYMTSLYSLQGTHQITGQNNFYQGRLWPGKSTVADPKTPNDKAFNAIFSVFIAEMLHLQLASNMCKAIGAVPDYTSPMLQSPNYGWICYGPDLTVLPHILDFKDTKAPYNDIRVKLGAVNAEQMALFLAIEETEEQAEEVILDDKKSKYFPKVPYANWQATNTETDLPMFGSIGHMYLCLWEYLSIQYTDGTTLWDYVFTSPNQQEDIFNSTEGGHMAEYPKMSATIPATDPALAQKQLLDMINGITDQGEGGGVVNEIRMRIGVPMLQAVQAQFQPDPEALRHNYKKYSDTGKEVPSGDASARIHYGSMDHYETFQSVLELVEAGGIETWDQWHAAGNKWTPEMLKTTGYDLNQHPIPDAEDISGALNNLKTDDNNYTLLSHAAAGAIAGVTTVLNKFWNQPNGTFPYPSMSGSGDRMSICWAIFGQAPDLSLGIEPRVPGVLYHACQGMDLNAGNTTDANVCAAQEVFHTCRGSNTCRAEGGCGFVQSVNGGGGGCSAKASYSFKGKLGYPAPTPAADTLKSGNLCGGPTPPSNNYMSAPADNKCGGFGGCAVPISASQMFPAIPEGTSNEMELFDFPPPTHKSQSLNETITYSEGELVYDVAWKAYCEVLTKRGVTPPADQPKPSDLRLAFPPST